MKYRASDGWKPKFTWKNTWKEYLLVGILFKPVAWILSFIGGFIYGFATGGIDMDTAVLIDNFSALVVAIAGIIIANHFIYKKLIKQHEKEVDNGNVVEQTGSKMSDSATKKVGGESFCIKCGTQHYIDSKFCMKCGNKLI